METKGIEQELIEWIFPEVGAQMATDQGMALFEDSILPDESTEEVRLLSKEQKLIEQQQQELAVERHQVELLKNDYTVKVQTLDNLLTKLRNPTSILDEELIDLIQDMIKKIAAKIVCQEIAADNKLLLKMINELKSMIDTKNGVVNIFLSPADFTRLEMEKNNLSAMTSVDPNLLPGDVVIKSNFAEVRALLNDRIEQLVRIEHD